MIQICEKYKSTNLKSYLITQIHSTQLSTMSKSRIGKGKFIYFKWKNDYILLKKIQIYDLLI